MGKYKILRWIFLLLSLIALVIAIVNITNLIKCSNLPPRESFAPYNPCQQYLPWAVGSIIVDIVLWSGFIYFLRKSKKTNTLVTIS